MDEGDKTLLEYLPPEILELIIAHLDGISLTHFGAVSSQCKGLSAHHTLWYDLCKRELGIAPVKQEASKATYVLKKKEAWAISQKFKARKATVVSLIKAAPSYSPGFWGRLKHRIGFLSTGTKMWRVLFCGLDAAGKTTMMYKFRMNPITTIPTIGFNVETASLQNWDFTAWDVGGPDKIRPLWRHYYQGTVALIWMVDSNDRDRFDESGEELRKMLLDDDFHSPYVLVYCNKQDLPRASSPEEIREKLKLDTIPKEITIHLQPCCAVTGEGLHEGLEWLGTTLAALEKEK